MSEPASAEAVIELAMAAFDAMPLHAAVLDGFSSRRTFVYNCDSPDEARLFRMTVGALRHAGQRFAVVVHNNVTPRAQLDPSG
ncbi:MAG: hypothetical protein P8J50_03245 [Acidimicrobiales bacterium]|nr:hypothetical protein [Acidimicrobiales bacterium]